MTKYFEILISIFDCSFWPLVLLRSSLPSHVSMWAKASCHSSSSSQWWQFSTSAGLWCRASIWIPRRARSTGRTLSVFEKWWSVSCILKVLKNKINCVFINLCIYINSRILFQNCNSFCKNRKIPCSSLIAKLDPLDLGITSGSLPRSSSSSKISSFSMSSISSKSW
mgnify:FL=1